MFPRAYMSSAHGLVIVGNAELCEWQVINTLQWTLLAGKLANSIFMASLQYRTAIFIVNSSHKHGNKYDYKQTQHDKNCT